MTISQVKYLSNGKSDNTTANKVKLKTLQNLTSSDVAPLFRAVERAKAPLFLISASPRFNVFKLFILGRTLKRKQKNN